MALPLGNAGDQMPSNRNKNLYALQVIRSNNINWGDSGGLINHSDRESSFEDLY